jgi:hypothetical protein
MTMTMDVKLQLVLYLGSMECLLVSQLQFYTN